MQFLNAVGNQQTRWVHVVSAVRNDTDEST